jgi:hypothetical protein
MTIFQALHIAPNHNFSNWFIQFRDTGNIRNGFLNNLVPISQRSSKSEKLLKPTASAPFMSFNPVSSRTRKDPSCTILAAGIPITMPIADAVYNLPVDIATSSRFTLLSQKRSSVRLVSSSPYLQTLPTKLPNNQTTINAITQPFCYVTTALQRNERGGKRKPHTKTTGHDLQTLQPGGVSLPANDQKRV